MLQTFNVSFSQMDYHLPAGQDTTAPIPYESAAIAGWGQGIDSSYMAPTRMALGSGINAALVQLQDENGMPLPDFTTRPYQAGRNRGRMILKILGPSMPGGAFCDVGAMAYAMDGSGVAGGLSNSCRIYLPAAPPTQKVTWEVKVNGQSMGYTLQTNQSDNVTFHRNGAMVWPNYIPGA